MATRFRPCIDLREGRVTQIVGGTLTDDGARVQTNFVTDLPPSHYAALYRRDNLCGGHVIMLGSGNEAAAREALGAWPGGMQVGGGIGPANARGWLDAGATHVIVSSVLFPGGRFSPERLAEMRAAVGAARLVVDLSCRRAGDGWVAATNRWQTLTDFPIVPARLDALVGACDELLIHAADVEGRCAGMDERLIACLGAWARLPVTYAGGARRIEDLATVERLSGGRLDVTIGSALDIFGGSGVRYVDCVAWNRNALRADQRTEKGAESDGQ